MFVRFMRTSGGTNDKTYHQTFLTERQKLPRRSVSSVKNKQELNLNIVKSISSFVRHMDDYVRDNAEGISFRLDCYS